MKRRLQPLPARSSSVSDFDPEPLELIWLPNRRPSRRTLLAAHRSDDTVIRPRQHINYDQKALNATESLEIFGPLTTPAPPPSVNL